MTQTPQQIASTIDCKDWGEDWAIPGTEFLKICEMVPHGSRILEFGSGVGTARIAKFFKVVTIEHDMSWLHYKGLGLRENILQIYSPLRNGWYGRRSVEAAISLYQPYAAWLIDGPPKMMGGRIGIIQNLHWLQKYLPKIIFIDDTNRPDARTVVATLNGYGYDAEQFNCDDPGKEGVQFSVLTI